MADKVESVLAVSFLALIACVALVVILVKIAQNITSTGQEGIF